MLAPHLFTRRNDLVAEPLVIAMVAKKVGSTPDTQGLVDTCLRLTVRAWGITLEVHNDTSGECPDDIHLSQMRANIRPHGARPCNSLLVICYGLARCATPLSLTAPAADLIRFLHVASKNVPLPISVLCFPTTAQPSAFLHRRPSHLTAFRPVIPNSALRCAFFPPSRHAPSSAPSRVSGTSPCFPASFLFLSPCRRACRWRCTANRPPSSGSWFLTGHAGNAAWKRTDCVLQFGQGIRIARFHHRETP